MTEPIVPAFDIPEVVRVRLPVPTVVEKDPVAAVQRELDRSLKTLVRGSTVAICVGSRGLDNLVPIVRSVVRWFTEQGARPFVAAAMGSHGGATTAGQLSLLAGIGVTAESVGAPVVADAESIPVSTLADGTTVYAGQAVLNSDGIVLINRIKPHTGFSGPVESGLAKMLAIGMGNRPAALELHAEGPAGLARRIPAVAQELMRVLPTKGCPVLGGLGLVENSASRTAVVRWLPPPDIAGEGERDLLRQAYELMPSLPWKAIDVLVLEQIGKDISGAGLDPHVIGRMRIVGVREPERPRIKNIVALRLTEASRGNASGIGLTDFAPRTMIDSIDLRTTYINALTAGIGGVQRSKLPITLADDREAIRGAIRASERRDPRTVRLAVARSTRDLGELLVTQNLAEEQLGAEVVGSPAPLRFDAEGTLLSEFG